MKRAALSIAALAVLLAGCAPAIPPRSEAAQVALPTQWRAAQADPANATQRVAAEWWHQAGDPVLDQLVATALAQNLDLHLATTRVLEARSQERAARAALLPTLDGGLGASRGQSVNAFGKPSLATAEQPMLQVGYEVDLFGRIEQQTEAARQGGLSAERARDAAALAVSASTVSGYLNLRALDQRLALLQQAQANREQALRLAEQRLAAGYTSQLEPAQARAELAGIRQQMPVVALAITRQENALALLTGTPPRAITRGKAFDALALPPVAAEQPSELLRRRPDIAQAENQLAASDAQLAVARAQWLPQLRLSVTLGRAFSTALPGPPITVWSLGGSLLAPLFEGGRLEGQFGVATARRDQAALAYKKTVLSAFKEVEDALAGIARLDEQQQALLAQQAALTDTVAHASRRYREGYSPYLEQIDAERALLAVQLNLIQARADHFQAEVALHQALGGGWVKTA